ncbi:MAG: tyrosine--tRNA ligase [Chloroflexi bacterium]|nr:tyrosine--tRNA ligase [Chloroflexota bacterium]
MPGPDQQTLDRILSRGVSQIIVEGELEKLLKAGKPLRLKMGFDPSRPDIHLGHVVGLRKLRQLQELGHQLILIVGDWTAQIGDPSGASITRPMLTAEEVRSNAESYMRQFFKVVDPDKTQAVYQSEWFGDFTLASVIKLTSMFTVNQFLHRDDFAKRYEAGRPIAVTEMLYPLLQAYDSIAIKSDVEFGGTDQMFNLLVGRELQEKMGERPQQCVMMPILPGTDGVRKMSKSLDNYIGVEEAPGEMFGKVMSLPDNLILTYFELLTDVPDGDLAEMGSALETRSTHPMELKKRLGREIVAAFHDAGAATQAQEEFERVVQQRQAPSEVPELAVNASTDGVTSADDTGLAVDVARFIVAVGLAPSRSEARRLLTQGAVELDGERVAEGTVVIAYGAVLKVGRRRFLRVVKG